MIFFSKFVLGLVAFAAAIYVLDWRKLADAAGQLTVSTTLFVLIVILMEFPFLAWRWHLIIREQTSTSARSALRDFETYFIAAFLGVLTPGHVGTDAYRFVSMRSAGVRARLVLTMLLKERLLGLLGYLLFLVIAALMALQTDAAIPERGRSFLLLCAVLSGLGVVTIISSRYVVRLLRVLSLGRGHGYLRETLKLVDQAFRFRSQRDSMQLLALTMVGDVNQWVLAFYIVALALGVDISFFLIGVIVIIVELVRLIPLTIQGIGVREAAFAALFAFFGQDPAIGFLICTVCFLLLNVVMLIVGLAGYAMAFIHRKLSGAFGE